MSPRVGLAEDLARGPAGEGRRAGEDLAEDRAQGEDVGPLVDPVDLAPGLLGRPCSSACPGPSRRATGPGPSRSGPWRSAVSGGFSLPAFASATTPPRGRTLARPQSITWTSPKRPTITFDGFRSRWITPRAWA